MTFKKLQNVQIDSAQNKIMYPKARTIPAQLTALHFKFCFVLRHRILLSISRNNQDHLDSGVYVYPLELPSLTHGITYS